MARFFSRLFRETKCLYYLLTFKGELHLVSIENSVVKNKREREQQPQKNSLATSDRMYKKVDNVLFFFPTFSCVCLHNYCSVNTWGKLCH